MHGGVANAVGTRNGNFKHGRHSKYLPSQLENLYEEAVTNPELLELGDHIALLESRVQEILSGLADGEPVPRWSAVIAAFGELETELLCGDVARITPALEKWHKLLDAGKQWDRSWDEIEAYDLKPFAALARGIGGNRAFVGSFKRAHHHGVDAVVVGMHAGDVLLQQLHAADLASAQALQLFGGGAVGEIAHVGCWQGPKKNPGMPRHWCMSRAGVKARLTGVRPWRP